MIRAPLDLAAALAGAAGLALLAQGLWIPAKAQVAQVLLARAFAEGLRTGEPENPWPWADTAAVARLDAPRLAASQIVLGGGSGEAMAFGPAELGGTPSGVRVLAAHRDTHFAWTRELRRGDELVLTPLRGARERYRITGFAVVRWDRFAMPATPARPLLALATCYPFDASGPGPLRRVAWAARIG